jgi:cytochrome oxidase Cu insertion factor (SCO1/SenC/PrrC family)
MTRIRVLSLLGIALLLGLVGLWLTGELMLGPGGPPARLAATRGGETVLALDGLLEELQILPLKGQPAPAFTLQTLEGTKFGLADLAGRPALLYFWATW